MLLWHLNIKLLIKHVFLRAISTHVYLKPKWLDVRGGKSKIIRAFCYSIKATLPLSPQIVLVEYR